MGVEYVHLQQDVVLEHPKRTPFFNAQSEVTLAIGIDAEGMLTVRGVLADPLAVALDDIRPARLEARQQLDALDLFLGLRRCRLGRRWLDTVA